jgi:putative transposase
VPYWRLFYHLIWATRGREPVLDADLARVVELSIRTTSADLKAVVHAVAVMPDHMHVAVSIPPSVAVSRFVGRSKGASSHAVNALDGREASFAWQSEYGALSFGERALPDVVAYVRNQQARHAADRLWLGLERIEDE